MEISKKGADFIKDAESFRKKSYWDVKGYAIAFGNHYHPSGKSVKVSDVLKFGKDSASAALYVETHLKKNVYPIIERSIKVQLSQNQFDALCSFIYNLGSLRGLTKLINSKASKDKIRTKWLSYDRYKKRGIYIKSQHLHDRRKDEFNLYASGVHSSIKEQVISKVKLPSDMPTTGVNLLINAVIKVAQSQLGVKEKPRGSNAGKEVTMYLKSVGLKSGYAWCAAFSYWVFQQATSKLGVGNPLAKTAGALNMYRNTKKSNGMMKVSNRQPELIVAGSLFVQDHGGGKGHIGIVEKVHDSGYITTVEGNTNKQGERAGTAVLRKRRKISKQHGFLVPIGATLGTSTNTDGSVGDVQEQLPKYVIIINDDREVDNLQKFIDKYGIKMESEALLEYEEYDNRASILKAYPPSKRKEFKTASVEHLAIGTRIAVPKDLFISKSIYSINQNVVNNKPYNTFIESQIKKIVEHPNHAKIKRKGRDLLIQGNFHKRYEFLQVWLWSKSMNENGSHLIDITKFIKTIETHVSENGGNFNITLPHIAFDHDSIKDNKELKLSDIFTDGFDTRTTNEINLLHKQINQFVDTFHVYNKKAYMSPADTEDMEHKYNHQIYKRKESFFHHILKNNDLLFIRLEKLKDDKNDQLNLRSSDNLSLSSESLPDNNFDMIGMVENLTISTTGEGLMTDISLNGKDLSKLLIDDGVYFFDIEYAVQDREQIIKNSSKSKLGNRLIIPSSNSNGDSLQDNTNKSLGTYVGDVSFNFDKTQSIEEWLTFIFSQLTNIDIAPDNLFRGYRERTFITTRQQSEEGFAYKKMEASGIWQIVKLAIDPEVGDRRVADQSFSTATGSLISLVRKICQPPFIDFYMDTYGDRYYFICRKPPYAEQAFKTNYCINVYSHDIITDTLQFENNFFTFFKLNPAGSIIDSSDSAALAFLPAVMLPEYMEIWGNKILDITTQYLDFDLSQSDQSQSNLDTIQKQGRQDLDWLIETNAYLPFTRSGSITIAPDRRIKRGMNIRYVPTGEIFHVDGVSHKKSLGETVISDTTLQVSRGMVEKYIDKYFNVINLLRRESNMDNWNKDTWTVNQDIFKFLLKNRQFL